ncbi:MAG: tetratricopeptide (TPR) repeat protein, partial [Myxococcota bacterium]
VSGCGTSGPGAIRVDGDLTALHQQYHDVVRANPGDARARAQLGAVLHEQKKHDDAVRHLSKAAGLAPTDPEIARWQGEALLSAGRPLEAHRAFERAQQHDPDWTPRYKREVEPRLLDGLADAAGEGKRVALVLELAKSLDADLMKRRPKAAARIWEADGDKLFGAGSNHQAINAYERSLNTGSARDTVRFKLARCHAVLRQLDRASARFDEYVAGATGDARVKRMIEIATFLDERFLFEQSRRWYEKASAAWPKDRGLKRSLGTVLLKARQWDEARKTFDGMLAGGAKASDYIDVARLYLKYRRLDDAIATWRKAIELDPADVGQWKVLAHLLVEKGRGDDIEAVIGHGDRHEAWGDVFTDLRQYSRAVARYHQALAGGGLPAIHLKLALAHHKAGSAPSRDKALAAFSAATGSDSKSLASVAQTYTRMGESDLALAAWNRVAKAHPNHEGAAFALATLYFAKPEPASAAKALDRFADGHTKGTERAAAWLKVARWYNEHSDGGRADKSVSQVLAQGETSSRLDALFLGAGVQRRLLQNYSRAEELYQAWIDAAPADKRHEARERVARLVRGVAMLVRFRNRLLEDMVRESPDQAATWYALAESYLTSRPPLNDEAGRAFERFIELSDDRNEAVLDVGARLARSNAWAAAARVYSKLAVEEIAKPRLHLDLARLYMRGQVNDKKRARAHLERFLESMGTPDRTVSEGLFRLAGQLTNRGLNDLAVAIYKRLLPHERDKTRILKPLGTALLGLGRDSEADEIFQSYLEATGRRHQAVKQVAEAFFQHRFYKRARTHYESLFNKRMRARLPRYFPRLFDIYTKLGDKPGLLDLSRRFVKLSPSSRSYSEAARRLEQAGLLREALEFWGQAAEKQPGAHVFRQQQAELALRLGELEEAERYLGRMIAGERGKASAWVRAGTLLADKGHDDRALALYASALEQGTRSGPIHLARALIHLRQGRFDAAHADFTRALTLAESLEEVLSTTREAYLRSGQISRYIDLLRRATALFPGRGETWFELGSMALRQGRHPEARAALDRYVEQSEKGLMKAGALLWQAGDLEGARRFYERALASPLFEGRHKALAELMSALSALGRPEEVPEAVSRFLVASTKPVEDTATLAHLLAETGYVREAIAYYEKVLAGAARGDGQLRLGRLWLSIGDVGAARRAFDRHLQVAVVEGPGVFRGDRGAAVLERVKRTRAIVTEYERAGREAQALRVVLSASRRHPEMAILHLERARLLLSSGKTLDGLSALEGLVRNRTVDPISPEDMEPVDRLIRGARMSREALEILKRTSPGNRSVGVSLELVRLSLRLTDIASARDEVDRMLAQSPHGGLRLAAGQAWFEAGRWAESTEMLLGALEPGRGTGSVEAALRQLLVIARLANQPALLQEANARVSRMYEDRRHYHRIMTEALADTGYADEAAEHALDWVESVGSRPTGKALLDGSKPSPWRLLMQIQVTRGDKAGARAAAQRYVSAAQNTGAAMRSAASLFRRHLTWDLALEMYEAAIERDAGDGPSLLWAGQMCLELGKDDKARAWFKRYISLGDDAVAGNVAVAGLWARHGEAETAEVHYAAASKAAGRAASRDEARPRMWLRKGDIKRARTAVRELIASAPDPIIAEVRFVADYLSTTEIPADLALEVAEGAIKRRPNPPHPVAQLVRAAALAELGRDDEARAALEPVLARGG